MQSQPQGLINSFRDRRTGVSTTSVRYAERLALFVPSPGSEGFLLAIPWRQLRLKEIEDGKSGSYNHGIEPGVSILVLQVPPRCLWGWTYRYLVFDGSTDSPSIRS